MGIFGKDEPEAFTSNGKEIKCLVCQNDKFWQTEAQLNKALSTFFHLNWTDETATCLVCTECGYILWFLPQ
jgi:hypothetical protein